MITRDYLLKDSQPFYDAENIKTHWPLFLSSSGGGGHHAAIKAIYQYLLNLDKEKKFKLFSRLLPQYKPVTPEKKPKASTQKTQILLGLGLPQPVKDAISKVGFLTLPDLKEVQEETQILAQQNRCERSYIDMLIDVYPTGYESVAIWNIFIKKDKTDEIKKLIDFHKNSDDFNYRIARKYFINLFEKAAKIKLPYTEIISTQAMALPALCDAVIYYNFMLTKKYNTQPIFIHQYITDLPSQGAVHFLNVFKRLTSNQRAQMILYGVDLCNVEQFNLPGFKKLVNIEAQNNPMVRNGFKATELNNLISPTENVSLSIQVDGKTDNQILLKPTEKIATIMLGSQAGIDTTKYVKELIQAGMFDKIFVFGGTASHIKKSFSNLSTLKSEIILLDNQDDCHIAPMMVKSDLIIIRGGGLSIMEQMALPHPPHQIILIHSKEDATGNLTSGISWEDCNVNKLEDFLTAQGIQARRTSTKLLPEQLQKIKQNNFNLLEDDEICSSKAFLSTHLINFIAALENYQTNKVFNSSLTSQIKKELVKYLIERANSMLDSLSKPTVLVNDIVFELAQCLRRALDDNKKSYDSKLFGSYRGRLGTLGYILHDSKIFIKKFYPSVHDKEIHMEKETAKLLGKYKIEC